MKFESKSGYKPLEYLNSLERYVYVDCRTILLSLIGTNDIATCQQYGLNVNSVSNFRRFNYNDFVSTRDFRIRSHRYLTVINLIKILESNGYEVTIGIRLKDTEI